MAGTTQLSTLTSKQKALFKKIDEDILNAIQEDGRSFSDFGKAADLWKNIPHVHFLGLTIHFFSRKFKYYSALIAFKKFKGRHLNIRIKRFILKILEKLGIANKIVAITTDNGSDIKKATTEGFGTRISCATHNLNLIAHSVVSFKKA